MIKMKKMPRNMTVVMLMLLALMFPVFSQAASIPSSRPFGGRILSIIPPNPLTGCFFPLIVVGLPSPGIFAITPATRPYREYQLFRPGVWVLGTASSFGRVCAVPPAASINMIGTSF